MSKLQVHPAADVEIAHLQQRIYLHRIGLKLSIEATQQAFRERLASPGMLLAAGATGFMLGRLTLTRRHAAGDQPVHGESSAAHRGLSVIAEALRTVLKFLRSGPGLWLASRFAARTAARSPQDPAADFPQ